MFRVWFAGFVGIALLVSGCGKNDPIVGMGYYPPSYQAPYGPGYAPQSPYYGGQVPAPYFQPQMPQGYPNQYTPFLPFDNYMRQAPVTQNFYVNLWVGWQNYSQQQGYNQYDFSRFWYDYCPQQLYGTQYWDAYQYYDQNYYGWVDPSMQWGQYGYDPGSFWGNYCDGYCY